MNKRIPVVAKDGFDEWKTFVYADNLREVEILCAQAFQVGVQEICVAYDDKQMFFKSMNDVVVHHFQEAVKR